MNGGSRLYLPEADDPRELPPTPWMGRTRQEHEAALVPAMVILRAVHHWQVIDSVALQAITGYSRATVRWSVEKLIRSRQIENIGYLRGLPTPQHSTHLVPFRKGPKRPSLPFFHPTKTGYIRPAPEADRPGGGGLMKIGAAAIRFHTLMIPKAVAWILGDRGLPYRTVPLPESVLRKEFGWYSEKADEADEDELSGLPRKRRLVKTAVPDAYLVSHRFSVRVEFEVHRKSFERYEAIFQQTNHGDIIFFVVYDAPSLFVAIRNFVEERTLPVCPIRWGNQEDLDAALKKVETIRSDAHWLPSRYRSGIVSLYGPATLDPALQDDQPPGITQGPLE